jgi:hypothetical protein
LPIENGEGRTKSVVTDHSNRHFGNGRPPHQRSTKSFDPSGARVLNPMKDRA